jgi:hypothetical protein
LIRQWLVRFATDCSEPVDPARIALFEDSFYEVPLEVLKPAFEATLKTNHFQGHPKVSDVWKYIDKANLSGVELVAAQKWPEVLSAADSGNGFGDFDAATQLAARRAGNLYHLDTHKDENFARERFIAAYKLIHETQQAENLLSDGEAKNIVRQLAAAQSQQPAQKELPPIAAPPAAGPLTENDIGEVRAAFNALRAKLGEKPSVSVKVLEAELLAEAGRATALTEEERIAEAKHVLSPEQFERWMSMRDHAKELCAAAEAGSRRSPPRMQRSAVSRKEQRLRGRASCKG